MSGPLIGVSMHAWVQALSWCFVGLCTGWMVYPLWYTSPTASCPLQPTFKLPLTKYNVTSTGKHSPLKYTSQTLFLTGSEARRPFYLPWCVRHLLFLYDHDHHLLKYTWSCRAIHINIFIWSWQAPIRIFENYFAETVYTILWGSGCMVF